MHFYCLFLIFFLETDQRSVDDLLSFINKNPKSTKEKSKKKNGKSKKGKKKEKKLSEKKKEIDEEEIYSEQSSDLEQDVEKQNQDKEEKKFEIDPEMEAALDREVEEFRQRLETINENNKDGPKIQLPASAASFASSVVGVH